ncbi:hypothetical protein [Streptomyces sp. NPDC056663]|uniref:hypothetical protein n=1 Tax=Streptomyces sp. NPDC056663 TaxID=3345899 RepID=UPI003697EF0A
MTQPDVLAVSAADADQAAAAYGYEVSPFMTRTAQATDAACPWQLIGFTDDGVLERAAVAWIIADAVMKNRAGHTRAYQWWRDAALDARPLSGDQARLVESFMQSVFGLPPKGTDADDHVPGYVGEWLWYLLTREERVAGHEVALLDPPSWSVTEGGADGFVVHRIAAATDTSLIFKLWEIKKFTGGGSVSATITSAATQLARRGGEYIAKLSWVNAAQPGDLGQLMSELTELWMRADPRGGAGVSVSTNTASAPKRSAFTQVPTYLPDLVHEGQLRGLIVAVEDFSAFAASVRGYVWSAL